MSRAASSVETCASRGPAFAAARLGEAAGGLREGLLLRGVVGRRVRAEEGVELGVGDAVDRGGPLHPAGVEPDDVVGVAHPLADDDVGRPGVVDPRRPGPARVDDERADPLRRAPARGTLTTASSIVSPCGFVVVDRHLEASRTAHPRSGPVEALRVEPGERLGPRRRALRADRHRRGTDGSPDAVEQRAARQHERSDRGTREGGDAAAVHGRTIGERPAWHRTEEVTIWSRLTVGRRRSRAIASSARSGLTLAPIRSRAVPMASIAPQQVVGPEQLGTPAARPGGCPR